MWDGWEEGVSPKGRSYGKIDVGSSVPPESPPMKMGGGKALRYTCIKSYESSGEPERKDGRIIGYKGELRPDVRIFLPYSVAKN